MRIDKLLWYLRLARSRSIAQGMAEEGHLRLNGRRIDRAHQKVACGDVLTIPMRPDTESLNLSMSVGIVLYKAWEKNGFKE